MDNGKRYLNLLIKFKFHRKIWWVLIEVKILKKKLLKTRKRLDVTLNLKDSCVKKTAQEIETPVDWSRCWSVNRLEQMACWSGDRCPLSLTPTPASLLSDSSLLSHCLQRYLINNKERCVSHVLLPSVLVMFCEKDEYCGGGRFVCGRVDFRIHFIVQESMVVWSKILCQIRHFRGRRPVCFATLWHFGGRQSILLPFGVFGGGGAVVKTFWLLYQKGKRKREVNRTSRL